MNALLSQASYDLDEELDPALSTDNASAVMENFTPETIQDRLVEYLSENVNDDGRLGDFISSMHPESFGPAGLCLTYNAASLSPTELDILENKQALKVLNDSYAAMGFHGSLSLLPERGDASGEKLKYHRGSYIENQRVSANPAVVHVNKLLNTTLVDARLLDKGEEEGK